MEELSESQKRRSAGDFLQDSLPLVLIEDDITTSEAELSPHCREAQNALRSATESAGSALWIGAVTNRLFKISDGKQVSGTWATPAQDNLRAAVLFAGAGLDRALKSLATDAIPILVAFDSEVSTKLSEFSERAITAGGAVSAPELVKLLLHEGTSPRDVLVRRWTSDLESRSAQSAGRVVEFASALGVTDRTITARIKPSKNKDKPLELAFAARNEIAHELDITQPEAEVRQPLERIRRRRKGSDMRQHVVEMLDVAQLIINDVATRLASYSQPQ